MLVVDSAASRQLILSSTISDRWKTAKCAYCDFKCLVDYLALEKEPLMSTRRERKGTERDGVKVNGLLAGKQQENVWWMGMEESDRKVKTEG